MCPYSTFVKLRCILASQDPHKESTFVRPSVSYLLFLRSRKLLYVMRDRLLCELSTLTTCCVCQGLTWGCAVGFRNEACCGCPLRLLSATDQDLPCKYNTQPMPGLSKTSVFDCWVAFLLGNLIKQHGCSNGCPKFQISRTKHIKK